MRAWLRTILLGAVLGLLVACTGGAGGPEGAVDAPSAASNQAGPVERPPVTVDSGPQESCVEYVQHAEDYQPEEVPVICKAAYENAPHAYHPEPLDIPQRVIPTIEGPAVVNTTQQVILPDQFQLHRPVPTDFLPPGLTATEP